MSNNELIAMQQELEALKAENARLKAEKAARISLKVSAKGGLSIYGLGRFPLTLYKSQANVVFSPVVVSMVQAFLKEHDSELSEKTDRPADTTIL